MKIFSQSMLDATGARAAASPRRRAHENVHADASDLVQRFFVVTQRGTYIRPHRHHTRSEMAIVLRGSFELVTFDDTGAVTGRHLIGAGTPNFGYETPQGTWHTLIARDDDGAFLEVKQGPYDPKTAAEFAPWAPAEGEPEAAEFLERLRCDEGSLLKAG